MNYNSIEVSSYISIRDLAISINEEGDKGQSTFINELARLMRITCKTHERHETQIGWMARLLNNEGKYLINQLNEFIKLEEGEIS